MPFFAAFGLLVLVAVLAIFLPRVSFVITALLAAHYAQIVPADSIVNLFMLILAIVAMLGDILTLKFMR